MDVSRLVTVIITTHNRASLLPRAINSVIRKPTRILKSSSLTMVQ